MHGNRAMSNPSLRNLTDRCRNALIVAGILSATKDRTTYPATASGETTLRINVDDVGSPIVKVRLSASGAVNRLHRIHVACYQCGEWIDAGHFSQHVGSAKCRKISDAIAYIESRHVETMAQVASMTPTEYDYHAEGCGPSLRWIDCATTGEATINGVTDPIGEAFAATFRAKGRCASIYQTAELAGVATPDQVIVSQAGTRGATNAILVHDPFQREEYVSAGMVRYRIGQATMTYLDRLNEASAL